MKRLLIILLAMCLAVPSFAGRRHKAKHGHHKSIAHHKKHKGRNRNVAAARNIEPPKELTVNDILSRMFESQKGCFDLPVQGRIADIEMRTKGYNLNFPPAMDIHCLPGEKVHAIHEGVVSSVFKMDGSENYIVIIQHGSYFTVYNSLATATVKKGDQVAARQTIGVVGSNDDGQPMLNFQIWKAGNGKTSNKQVSPSDWFARM